MTNQNRHLFYSKVYYNLEDDHQISMTKLYYKLSRQTLMEMRTNP